MAQDLGLNVNADNWQYDGRSMFTAEQKQLRKQVWWICVSMDTYVHQICVCSVTNPKSIRLSAASAYMGRSTCISSDDYDTPLPDIDPKEESKPWRPTPDTRPDYPAMPSRPITTFTYSARLGECDLRIHATFAHAPNHERITAIIEGAIMSQIYPVRAVPRATLRQKVSPLEEQLTQWYIALPNFLRYDSSSSRLPPPAHILYLNIRYWAAVLLLLRTFIPKL